MGVISSSLGANQPSVIVSSADPVVAPFAEGLASVSLTHNATTTAPVANQAVYVPFVVREVFTVYQLGVVISTQSGNLDVGIYDVSFARLVSSGSTAMAAAGVQAFNVTDTTLAPGNYYFAVAIDNTTARIRSSVLFPTGAMRVFGFATQTSALPLPATATPVAVATAAAPFIFAYGISKTI